jgi:hypothetical protein
MLGPFKVFSVESNLQYCMLKLTESSKIHLVCIIDLLQQFHGTDPKKQLIEIEADGEDWVVESIIASGPSDDNPKQYVFLL